MSKRWLVRTIDGTEEAYGDEEWELVACDPSGSGIQFTSIDGLRKVVFPQGGISRFFEEQFAASAGAITEGAHGRVHLRGQYEDEAAPERQPAVPEMA